MKGSAMNEGLENWKGFEAGKVMSLDFEMKAFSIF
jgi:hypothetical protein